MCTSSVVYQLRNHVVDLIDLINSGGLLITGDIPIVSPDLDDRGIEHLLVTIMYTVALICIPITNDDSFPPS